MRKSIRPDRIQVTSMEEEDFNESEVVSLGNDTMFITDFGNIDVSESCQSILDISDKFFTNLEADLVFLLKDGRRSVEISKILQIPECEVIRLRRNTFRKLRILYLYEKHLDKQKFVDRVLTLIKMNDKQQRIFTMFFNFYGLRQIAEAIGSRPSNVHRSLSLIKDRIEEVIPADDPDRVFLNAFRDFKYLRLVVRDA